MKKRFKNKHRVGLAKKFIWKNPDELLGQPNIIRILLVFFDIFR